MCEAEICQSMFDHLIAEARSSRSWMAVNLDGRNICAVHTALGISVSPSLKHRNLPLCPSQHTRQFLFQANSFVSSPTSVSQEQIPPTACPPEAKLANKDQGQPHRPTKAWLTTWLCFFLRLWLLHYCTALLGAPSVRDAAAREETRTLPAVRIIATIIFSPICSALCPRADGPGPQLQLSQKPWIVAVPPLRFCYPPAIDLPVTRRRTDRPPELMPVGLAPCRACRAQPSPVGVADQPEAGRQTVSECCCSPRLGISESCRSGNALDFKVGARNGSRGFTERTRKGSQHCATGVSVYANSLLWTLLERQKLAPTCT
ncbi:hypothetical protein V8C35DRAFT_309967 [Trichoderma chlorosporum]